MTHRNMTTADLRAEFAQPTLPLERIARPTPTPPAAEASPERVLFAASRKPAQEGGAPEELRLTLSTFNGALFLRAAHFYKSRDGWRPTKLGVTIRRGEVRAVIAALLSVADELAPEGSR